MADPTAVAQITMVAAMIRENADKSTELLAAFAEMTALAAAAKETSAVAAAAVEQAEMAAGEARLAAERFAALVYALRPARSQ